MNQENINTTDQAETQDIAVQETNQKTVTTSDPVLTPIKRREPKGGLL
jgi:hypothetical protein